LDGRRLQTSDDFWGGITAISGEETIDLVLDVALVVLEDEFRVLLFRFRRKERFIGRVLSVKVLSQFLIRGSFQS